MNTIEMQYIGVLSLLARISQSVKYSEDLISIESAFEDACDAMPGRFEWGKANRGYFFQTKTDQLTEEKIPDHGCRFCSHLAYCVCDD